jgi:hypothetical protein
VCRKYFFKITPEKIIQNRGAKNNRKTARKNNRKNNNRAQAHKKIYNYGRRTKGKDYGYFMLDCGFVRSGIPCI